MSDRTFLVPNVLASGPNALEALFNLLGQIDSKCTVKLDMSAVGFVHPYGIVSLASFVRYVNQLTHARVSVSNCRQEILAYLQRVDFFEECKDWAFTTTQVSPKAELKRSDASANLLELSSLRKPADVLKIASRTKAIVETWLGYGLSDQNQLINILSEMCDNVFEHSGDDFGHINIQRYIKNRGFEVRLAVQDMGMGIRRSLQPVHGHLGSTAIEYIQAALNGTTRRKAGIQGNGFQRVQEIVRRYQGTLYVRSETGAIRVSGLAEPDTFPDLVFFPGTLVAIHLHQQS